MTDNQCQPDTVHAAAKFVMWALLEGSWQGCDIDGGSAQDKALALGLIVETIYDPAKHGETSNCEPGDAWFVPSEGLLDVLRSGDEAVAVAVAVASREPVAWRYKCRDGSEVLMLKRLTDEQKRRGYYTGEDGEDEVDGDEAVIGPFHWAEETPLFAALPSEAIGREDGEAMDDFIRAILADNNPRSDEPYATVAKWIRLIRLAYPIPEKASTVSRPTSGGAA